MLENGGYLYFYTATYLEQVNTRLRHGKEPIRESLKLSVRTLWSPRHSKF